MVSVVRRRDDKARQHAAICALLEQFKREIVEHSPHVYQLAPSYYQMFLHLKKFLAGQRFRNDKETKGMAERLGWLPLSTKDIKKVDPQCAKCLQFHGDCVER
jgi:hypothetical protein